jgi:hypothetical protein
MTEDYQGLTPPPELVQQLYGLPQMRAIEKAYQAGADQELEAIQKEIITQAWFADPRHRLAQLRAARRPKPPSLKEQALNEFDSLLGDSEAAGAAVILRALEALPDD